MKAVAVTPGRAMSAELRDIPKPSVSDAPDGKGVLVKVLRVGLDGTDREIYGGEYGVAPAEGTQASRTRPSNGRTDPLWTVSRTVAVSPSQIDWSPSRVSRMSRGDAASRMSTIDSRTTSSTIRTIASSVCRPKFCSMPLAP